MRKTRVITATTLALVVTTSWWGWHERINWLPGLFNFWIAGGKIQKIEDFSLNGNQLHAVGIRFKLDSGDTLTISEAKLDNALALLHFGKQPATLLIGELARIPLSADIPPTLSRHSADANSSREADKPLRLSQLLEMQRSIQIKQIQIDKLIWPGKFPFSGKVELDRLGDQISGVLTNNDYTVAIELTESPENVDLQVTLSARQPARNYNQKESAVKIGDLAFSAKKMITEESLTDSDYWTGKLTFNGKISTASTPNFLPALSNLPFRNPAGTVNGEIRLEFPDQLQKFERYRNINAQLESQNFSLDIPQSQVEGPLTFKLNTQQPVTLALKSLSPLRAQQVVGAVELAVITPSTTGEPKQHAEFLTSKIKMTTENYRPKISAAGKMDLTSASTLVRTKELQKFWKNIAPSIEISEVNGEIPFKANFRLPPIDTLNTETPVVLDDLYIEIMADSNATISLNSSHSKSNLLTDLGWKNLILSNQLPEPIIIESTQWPGKLTLRARQLLVSATDHNKRPLFEARINNTNCLDLEKLECKSEVDGQITQFNLEGSGANIHQITLATNIVHRKELANNWVFSPISISAKSLSAPDLKIQNLEYSAEKFTCKESGEMLQCQIPLSQIGVAPLEYQDSGASGMIRITDLAVRLKDDQLQANASYQTDSLAYSALNQFEGELTSSGEFNYNGQQMRGKSTINFGKIIFNGNWIHNIESNDGELEGSLKQVEFSPHALLSHSIKGLPFELADGALSGKIRVSWPQKPSDSISLNMQKLTAAYDTIFAIGITGNLQLSRKNDLWISTNPASFEVQQLDPGIPIKNLTFDASLNADQDLIVEKLSADILDGKLASENLIINLQDLERHSVVTLQGISLKTLAKQLGTENFSATGLVDARIPLVSNSEGITVDQGKVEARAPGGRLRYYGAFSPDMLTSNPQLKLIAGALEDYNYREMSGTIDYPPSGDLQLQLRLVGSSHAVDAKRDLIINLNLENNIPSMLKSLQASRDLTDVLERQLQ